MPNTINAHLTGLTGLMISLIASPVFAADSNTVELETITITGDAEARERTPGSVHKVDKKTLEQWQYIDIHRVLADAPGVYVRDEDGYGLRPNIGMRGSGSDRSKKIALMEDGILFAPAPYSAPAAYYFPLLARIQSVEVFKGPSAIKYGPNTVGGAINFVSRTIPTGTDEDKNGAIDVALGSFGFGKLHGYYGKSEERFGWLIEGVKLKADGFKELDGGGDTGFDKNDVMLKLRVNSDQATDLYHQFDLKVGYADEISDETYLGLTDADFKANSVRRYASSALDEMDWTHKHYSLSHFFDPGGSYAITSTVYRRDYSRVWDKLNGFAAGAPSLPSIFANPNSAINAGFYEVLSGQADSTSPSETLLLGANARDFIAQGIQSEVEWEPTIAGHQHKIELGFRYHEDEIERNHTERRFLMQAGQLVSDGSDTVFTTRNRASAEALAIHLQDEVTIGKLTLSGGFRSEFITTEFVDVLNNQQVITRDDDIFIPGFGASYKVTPHLRVLGGIHKGFVPAPPGSAIDVEPEESVNYEIGLRYTSDNFRAEAIGFYNDYSNLSGSCTFSSGCATNLLDLGFNAGEVDVWGLEAEMQKTFTSEIAGGLKFPVKLNYTFTGSEFKNSFTSPRPDLSDVRIGDELPYLPEHQLNLKVGVGQNKWRTELALKYVAAMRTTAGTGTAVGTDITDSQTVVDLSANYQLSKQGQVYLTVDNVFDDQSIVARRPFGARSGKPRSFMLGYKLDF